jgi:hypothetical protein
VRGNPGQTTTAVFTLALLVLIAYGASLGNGFVFDDAIFMDRDVRIHEPVQWRQLLTQPLWAIGDKGAAGAVHQYYRPLQLLPLAATNTWASGSFFTSSARYSSTVCFESCSPHQLPR